MNTSSKILLLSIIGIMQMNPFILNAEEFTSFVTDNSYVKSTNDGNTTSNEENLSEEMTTLDTVTEDITTKGKATKEATTIDQTTEEVTTVEQATKEATTVEQVTKEATIAEKSIKEKFKNDDEKTILNLDNITKEATTAEKSIKEKFKSDDENAIFKLENTTNEVTTEKETTEVKREKSKNNDKKITLKLENAALKQVSVKSKSSSIANLKLDLSENTTDTSTRKNLAAGKQKINANVDHAMLISESSTAKADEGVKIDLGNINVTHDLYAKEIENTEKAVKNVKGNQFLVDKTGSIIAAAESSFMTIGGVDHISYLYGTPKDAENHNSDIPINGGGQLGRYLDTAIYNGNYYAHVEIGGTRGYMLMDEIQILPSTFDLPEAYYEVNNGDWIKVVPIDPLTTNQTIRYTVGSAPSFAKSGVKYYSTDDETFYLKEIGNSRGEKPVAAGATYFQNLPIRSTTEYTGEELKDYMLYKSSASNRPDIANSQYIDATEAFIKAQEYYGVNGLLLFAFANHESSYGTSTQAQQCNNFFGRGAVDSDPANGCVVAHFENPADGILAQAGFLTQFYTDVADWRYYGTNPGNKQSGLNAKYASDANWGVGIASMMYNIDQYLGKNEEGKFRIVKLESTQPVYKNAELSEQYTLTGQEDASDYNINQKINTWTEYDGTTPIDTITENPSEARFVVTKETDSAIQIQLPTAIADKTGYIPFSFSSWGEYPYFEGVDSYPYGNENQTYPNYVIAGTGNSFAPYASKEDWARNRGWISKVNEGNLTYEIINDVDPVLPTGPDKEDVTDPTLYAELKTANFTGVDMLNIEGVGYLKGINSATHPDIKHELVVVNNETNKEEKRYDLGNVINPEVMDDYETDGYQYDSGYFATQGYSGVDLSKLNPGTYDLQLYAESEKNPAANDQQEIKISDDLIEHELKSSGKYNYTLYANNDKLMLDVEEKIVDVENPVLKTSARKANFIDGDFLNVEGVGYLKGINTPETTNIDYTLKLINPESNKTVKSYEIDAKKNADVMNKYEDAEYQYDAGYFNAQAINLSTITPGTYQINLYAKSTKNPNANSEEPIYVSSSFKSKVITSEGTLDYTLYAKDNTLMLKVEEPLKDVVNPELKTSFKNANFTSEDKLNIEGVGYLKGINSEKNADIKHELVVVNNETNKEEKRYDLGNVINSDVMDKYETDGYQYDSGYFATQGYSGVDLSKLNPGTYALFLYAESGKNSSANDEEQIYVNSNLTKLKLESSGKYNYTLYAKNNKLMLDVEAKIVDVENPELKTSIQKARFSDGDLLNMEGVGYLKGINTPETTNIDYTLKLINPESDKTVKSYEIDAKKNADVMNKYEDAEYQYDAGYFNAQVINLSTVAPGTYQINLYAKSTKNPNANDEEPVYVKGSLESKVIKSEGILDYTLYVKDHTLMLKVEDKLKDVENPDLKTSLKKANFTSEDKLNIEGVGYLKGINSAKNSDITHSISFINDKTNKVAKSYEVGNVIYPSILNKYETDGYQYDAGYFATQGYSGVDLAVLDPGTYRINLYAESIRNPNANDEEQIYVSSSLAKSTLKKSGTYNYVLYAKDNKLMLDVE